MFKVFVEYAIQPESRDSYLNYMRGLRRREGRLTLLEGSDQPGLFVEIWDGMGYEEYEQLKRLRLDEAGEGSDEAQWEEWVAGGKRKLHMWHFTECAQ